MTKKHFIKIAEIVRAVENMVDRQNMAHSLADYFKAINPNFDRARFLAACGC